MTIQSSSHPPLAPDTPRSAAWDRRTVLGLLLLGLAGILLVLANTRWGAFWNDDTYYYIYPGRDLLAGKGFQPSYIFAPLFPAVLALLGLLGMDALVAARWLNALLFGVNIFLTGRIVWRMNAPRAFIWLAAGLVLLSDVVIEAHGWAMSEALSFTWMLLCLDLTLDYLAHNRARSLWLAAAAAALTVLTRYAAVPLIAAVAVTLLCYAPGARLAQRLRAAMLFSAAGLTPIVAYWLRNQITSGRPTRYVDLLLVPFSRDQLDWFLYHWFSLFIPGRLLREREILFAAAILLACAAACLALGWLYRGRWTALRERRVAGGLFLLAALIAINLVMLYLARGLVGLDVFNSRYLVPLLIVFLAGLLALAGQLWLIAGRWVRLGLSIVLAVFALYYAYRTVDFTRQTMRAGLGYSNVGWHNSETIAYLYAHPDLVEMVSTGEMGIYFWTGRKPLSLAEFPSAAALKDYLCQRNAVLLVMDQMPAEIYGIALPDIEQTLARAQDFNDSDMFRCPDGP